MKSTIILSLVAALPMLAQCPCAAHAPQQRPAMHCPCAQQRPNVEAMKARIMEKFDVNKDGQLDDSEKEAIKKDFEAKKAEAKAKFMEKFDTNKDGQIDDAEKEAIKKAFEAKKAEMGKCCGPKAPQGKPCCGKPGMRRGHGMHHGRHGMHFGPRPMISPEKAAEMKAKFMEKFDTNKDGKIDEQEKEAIKKQFEAKAAEMKAKFMEKYDTNKDGQLSDEEKAAVKKDFEAKKAECAKKFGHRGHGFRHGHHGMRHGRHHGMRHGKPCCGKPAPKAPCCGAVPGTCGKPAMSKEEMEARKAKFMEKFDANKDGQLSDEEKAAAKKFFECRMQVKHHRGHGMRGHRHGKPCCGKPMPGWQPKKPCGCCRKPAPEAPAPAAPAPAPAAPAPEAQPAA